MQLNGSDKILTGTDVVHIAEDAALTECLLQVIGQSPCKTGAVIAAIREKNSGHGSETRKRRAHVHLRNHADEKRAIGPGGLFAPIRDAPLSE
jgi:hypothetical protein